MIRSFISFINRVSGNDAPDAAEETTDDIPIGWETWTCAICGSKSTAWNIIPEDEVQLECGSRWVWTWNGWMLDPFCD